MRIMASVWKGRSTKTAAASKVPVHTVSQVLEPYQIFNHGLRVVSSLRTGTMARLADRRVSLW